MGCCGGKKWFFAAVNAATPAVTPAAVFATFEAVVKCAAVCGFLAASAARAMHPDAVHKKPLAHALLYYFKS